MGDKKMILKKLLVFLSVVFLASCGKKTDDEPAATTSSVTILPQMLRIAANNTTLVGTNWALTGTNLSSTETYSTDVTIKSLKYPIASIGLSDPPVTNGTVTATASGSNSFNVYECTSTTVAGCMVDLTGTALQNLITSTVGVTAKIGTFTQINIGMCPGTTVAAETYFLVTAEVNINGVMHYTNATTGLSTTGPAAETKITNAGGCTSGSYLGSPLVIGASDVTVPDEVTAVSSTEGGTTTTKTPDGGKLKGNLDLRLYFDLANAVYGSGGSSNTASGVPSNNCFGSSGTTPYICVNFPKIIGTLDSTTPTLVRMLMNSYTIYGFYFGSSAIPFGAYQRVYYNTTFTGTMPDTLLGPDFAKVEKNADGTFKVRTLNDDRYYYFDTFQFATHTGTYNKSGTTTAYTATKL